MAGAGIGDVITFAVGSDAAVRWLARGQRPDRAAQRAGSSTGETGTSWGRGLLIHPREFEPPGELAGAEALHRLFRHWLTKLGHPQPAAEGVAEVPAVVP